MASYRNTTKLVETEHLVGHTRQVRFILNDFVFLLRSAETGQSVQVTVLEGTMLVLLLMILAGLLFTRTSAPPPNEISSTAEQLASGKPQIFLSPFNPVDEIGALVQTFSRLSQSLASEIVAATTQIASGAVVKQSKESGESVRILAASAAEVAQAAAQIAAKAQQQSTGIDPLAFELKNIRRASMQNAACTNQEEMAVRDLHELGKRLKRLSEQS